MHHWTEELKNVSSEALRKVWRQLASTFSYYTQDRGPDKQWTILQPPTGSGKTQGTVIYCSMLARLPIGEHPGVLIVTRLKADASQIAHDINRISGKNTAVAYHTDTKEEVKISDLCESPVVVITHRAYELALDFLGEDGVIQQTWPLLSLPLELTIGQC